MIQDKARRRLHINVTFLEIAHRCGAEGLLPAGTELNENVLDKGFIKLACSMHS